MQLINKAEALALLAARNAPCELIRSSVKRAGQAVVAVSKPEPTAGRTYAISRGLCDWITADHPEEVLVLIVEHGIWPSSENERLLQLLLRAHGQGDSSLDERPGFRFHSNERDDLVTLVQIGLISGWGLIVAADSHKAMSFDHDGHFGFLHSDELGLATPIAVLI